MSDVTVILADTRHAGNIGSVARVMKNMGFKNLTLVNPTPRTHMEAIRMGVGAEEIIERSAIVPTLEEAIQPLVVTYALTKRRRRIRKQVFTPAEAMEDIVNAKGGVGLVFGSEKFGLSNEQTMSLDHIITIPVSPEHSSINLAQAVAMLLYELRREVGLGKRYSKHHKRCEPADMESRKYLYERMTDALKAAGFYSRANASRTMAQVEDIFNRAELDDKDVKILLGVFKQIKKSITGRV